MGLKPIPRVPVRSARSAEEMRIEAARHLYVIGAITVEKFEALIEEILSGQVETMNDIQLFQTAFPRPTMETIRT